MTQLNVNMVKVRTRRLSNRGLNWAVAICERIKTFDSLYQAYLWPNGEGKYPSIPFCPCINPDQGMPILDREGITLNYLGDNHKWTNGRRYAAVANNGRTTAAGGKTILEAGLRCYVAAKLGDEIEMPETLMTFAAISNPVEFTLDVNVIPGFGQFRMGDVMMQDIVGEYDKPDVIPEWVWIEKSASFSHVRNAEHGVWEFILNLRNSWEDIPDKLVPVIDYARASGLSFLIFHQGT